jgi:nicastrin
LGGFLITDHEKTFKNPFYHSVFDTAENLNITFPENITEQEAANFTTNFSRRLQFAITSIAKSIYSFSSDNKELDDQANQITLNRLVYCFYKNSTCEYFKSILTTSQWQNYQTMLDSLLPKKKLSFYTSVNDAQISGKWITQMLLKYFTRNILFDSLNSTDCNKNSVAANKLITENSLRIASINFVNNSTCVATSVYAVSSVSPAFDKYDQGILVDTDRFSAWTESNWNGKTTQMRLFIFTTNSVNISTILIGVVTFLFSFVATYLVNKNSNKWFALNNSEQTDEIIEQ